MAETTEKKPNVLLGTAQKAKKFLRDIKGEIKKIVWPAPRAVFKNTGIVMVTIVIIGLFIFGLDQGLVRLLGLVMNVAG